MTKEIKAIENIRKAERKGRDWGLMTGKRTVIGTSIKYGLVGNLEEEEEVSQSS